MINILSLNTMPYNICFSISNIRSYIKYTRFMLNLFYHHNLYRIICIFDRINRILPFNYRVDMMDCFPMLMSKLCDTDLVSTHPCSHNNFHIHRNYCNYLHSLAYSYHKYPYTAMNYKLWRERIDNCCLMSIQVYIHCIILFVDQY